MPEFVVGLGLVVLFATTVFGACPRRLADPARRAPLRRHGDMVLPVARARARGHALRGPDHARLDDRGARVRLRRDGPAQGHQRATVLVRHALPNALGPDLPGDRAEPRLPRRRRDLVENVFNYPGIGARSATPSRTATSRRAGARDDHRHRLRRAEPARGHRDHPRHAAPAGRACERRRRQPAAIRGSPAAHRPTRGRYAPRSRLWRTRIGLISSAPRRIASSAAPSRRTARPSSSASRTPGRATRVRHRPARTGRLVAVPLGRRAAARLATLSTVLGLVLGT